MQSCGYCSPLNVVDLIVDIMFIIDILINFRSETFHMLFKDALNTFEFNNVLILIDVSPRHCYRN